MLPHIDPAAIVHAVQPEMPDPNDHFKRMACKRISSRWEQSIIQEAKGLIMRSPWNLQDLDNNHLVVNVRIQLLAGADNFDCMIEAIIAVMAITQFYLPRSWNQALLQLPFEKGISLRALFDDIEHPERNKRLQKFLAVRKPLGERAKGLWTSVVGMFQSSTPTATSTPPKPSTESTPQDTAISKSNALSNPEVCRKHPAPERVRSHTSTQFTSEDADDEASADTRSKVSYRSVNSDRSRKSRFSEHLHAREGSECSQKDVIPGPTPVLRPPLSIAEVISGGLATGKPAFATELSIPEPVIVTPLAIQEPAIVKELSETKPTDGGGCGGNS